MAKAVTEPQVGAKVYRSKVFENLISFDDLLTLELRSEFSRHTVYKWIERGLPTRKIGGRHYFSPAEVALWLGRNG